MNLVTLPIEFFQKSVWAKFLPNFVRKVLNGRVQVEQNAITARNWNCNVNQFYRIVTSGNLNSLNEKVALCRLNWNFFTTTLLSCCHRTSAIIWVFLKLKLISKIWLICLIFLPIITKLKKYKMFGSQMVTHLSIILSADCLTWVILSFTPTALIVGSYYPFVEKI